MRLSLAGGLLGDIVSTFSQPVFATTVNVTGASDEESVGPAISIYEVNQFATKSGIGINLIIDGGICPAFNHTTIVDCRNQDEPAKIVREGFVQKRAIELALRINERR